MSRIKIDYGIDLGTTNSAICRMESGEPVIRKTDTLKDTMPSCVSFTKKKSIKAGDSAFNDLKQDKRRATKSWKKTDSNTFVEFKRAMGTDTSYLSSHMGGSYSAEQLSSETLKTLKSFITDESVSSVVITVPAKFTINQKEATTKAATLAGFSHCELLQEPIAASMAYGISSNQKHGYWLVFDFGGGTFDAALLKVEDGIMQVFDTEGDNYLGGKNLDEALVNEVFIPYLKNKFNVETILSDQEKRSVLVEAMKTYAEEAKNQLSFKQKEDIISNLGDLGNDDNGEELELDFSITQSDLEIVFKPIFQKAINLCLTLLDRNNIKGSQLDSLILIGGPTYSPILRQMLKEQITTNVDTSIDPMTAVARGAALYASTIDNEAKLETTADTVTIDIGYEATTVELSEWITVKLAPGTTAHTSSKLYVELVRSDKAWSSGKVELNEIGDAIEAHLFEGKPNAFAIFLYDEVGNSLPCYPTEITILQGSKVGAAPLPYHIGIEVWSTEKEKSVFVPIKGLEKNQLVPAVGTINGLKTTKQLRPGIATDTIKIPIYQGDDGAEGKSAFLYEYVADVVITGDDVPSFLPENSDVDITIKVDRSERMSMQLYFPSLDHSEDVEISGDKKQKNESDEYLSNEIGKARNELTKLGKEGCDTSDLKTELDDVQKELGDGAQKKQVLQNLKKVRRKIEDLDSSSEWSRVEKDLREEFDQLDKANKDLGNEKSSQMVSSIRQQAEQAIKTKDVKLGRAVLEDIRSLFVQLTMIFQLVGFVRHHNEAFGQYLWKNPMRARQLLNEGLQIIVANPTVEVLHPLVIEIINLLPNDQIPVDIRGLLKKTY